MYLKCIYNLTLLFTILWGACIAEESAVYYYPYNVTRTTISAMAAYRSALTLDWLAAEDMRQRELASAFETEPAPPARVLTTDCIAYSRPAAGKVARLMLELLKNLEGDDGVLITELIQGLMHSKLLVETAMLEAEPDLEALVKTPGVMMGEPHTTFPRILAMIWMTVTDPVTTKKFGWCSISRVNRYLAMTKPVSIAKHMRALEPIVARARFIMEEFIQHVTPLNMYEKKGRPHSQIPSGRKRSKARDKPLKVKPARTTATERDILVANFGKSTIPELEHDTFLEPKNPKSFEKSDDDHVRNSNSNVQTIVFCKLLLALIVFVL